MHIHKYVIVMTHALYCICYMACPCAHAHAHMCMRIYGMLRYAPYILQGIFHIMYQLCCGMIWHGMCHAVMWYGVVGCGMPWCTIWDDMDDITCYGIMWYAMLWHAMTYYYIVWQYSLQNGMVWYGTVRYCTVWH